MPTFEYRKLFRTDVILKIHYNTLKQPIKQGFAFTKNISSVGMNVIMADSLVPGAELELKIYLVNSEHPIQGRGQVMWQSSCSYVPQSQKRYYSTGIQLVYMSNEDAIRTSDFVKETVKKHSEDENKKIITMIEKL